MAFQTPRLDDRTFQQIVDEAKRLIPKYCPEWTDHNVSDPGVALIELFAWMTDMLLFRVNQVPERMYVRFLEMIGVSLKPPQPALAEITFFTSKGLSGAAKPIPIPAGTEISTARLESDTPVIFSTEQDEAIQPADLRGVYTFNSQEANSPLVAHDLNWLRSAGEANPIVVFPEPAQDGDALYLALAGDHSQYLLHVVVSVGTQSGTTGIKPANPPWVWQVSQEGGGWADCEEDRQIESLSGGFSKSGVVRLHIPSTQPATHGEQTAYWLRCVVKGQEAKNRYERSPRLTAIDVEARGLTVQAKNALRVTDELLGRSSGKPGQAFKLQHDQLLPLDPEHDTLLVTPPDAAPEDWRYVADFADCTEDDKVFSVDYREGTLKLAPAAPQPDGTIYAFGAVPPQHAELVLRRYQYWGGYVGRVPSGALTALRETISYVARAENRRPSTTGNDAESPEYAKIRAPSYLRTRTRAVTADDYEYWACEGVPGVARASCVHPGEQKPGQRRDDRPEPGFVRVYILPATEDPLQPPTTSQIELSPELHTAVLQRLAEVRPLGIAIDVQPAQLLPVEVRAALRPSSALGAEQRKALEQQAQAALSRFLNPYVGGATGRGWPFGRALYLAEIYAQLQRLPGIGLVEEVAVTANGQPLTGTRLDLPAGAVVCSGKHTVQVRGEPA